MPNSKEYKLLNTIESPADLKKLEISQLPQLCEELRSFIIDVLSSNPGHLASSLGTVEITVALHYVYNLPYDRIVWDVGHQAYSHKILTGRRERFCTNRKFKGLAPFPSPAESEYDSFVSGHASNSISAALGMAVADRLNGNSKRKIVAFIGDGALTGGLAFEGLNNMSSSPNDTMIVLNDNEMAIDPVVGGLSHYLTQITTSRYYNKLRYKGYLLLRKMGLMKNAGRMVAFNNSVKSLLVRQHNIFESLNIRYFGPVDGHDVVELVRILNAIKDFGGPKVLHIKTVKGKGSLQAENAPTIWHAPGLFDENTGQRKTTDTVHQPPLYQDVFGNTLVELAEKNDKIVGVTPAMPTGCSMNILGNRYPDRMFDVGIAEGHAVTFSAGMAKEGLLPFCNIYSTFAQRAYDNIIHDVAIQKLNMVICLDRAGIVGNDGVTHHGLFDIAALRCIPNLTLASPFDEKELRNMLFTAQLPEKGTFVIRYPRGRSEHEDWRCEFQEIPVGKGVCVKNGDDLAVLSFGPIGNRALEAITETEKTSGKTIALYNMRFAKPLDEELLREVARKFEKIVTIEDGMLAGGFGSAVSEFFEDNHLENKIKRLGVPDHFVEHGSVSELYQTVGLDKTSLCNLFEDICRS